MGLFALALAAFVFGACGGPLSAGKSQFEDGRYPEAKRTLASVEAESRTWDEPRRAEYALYRGLTLGALGDRAQAVFWLREAKAIEDSRPAALSREDVERLRLGLQAQDVP